MFLGGTVAFVLDNTVPGKLSSLQDIALFFTISNKELSENCDNISGSQEERGMIQWRQQLVKEEGEEGVREQSKCYDIPFITKYLDRHGWTRHIPVCSTFTSYQCNCCDKNKAVDDEDRTSEVQDSSINKC